MKRTAVITSFIFNTVFVACITLAAIRLDMAGLLWCYLLPSFITFCTIVGAAESEEDDK